MRVLMGMPKRGLAGGPQGHLPFLVEGLRGRGVSVDELTYGSRTAQPSLASRVALVLSDARVFRDATLRERYDVVQLNTAFDLKAMLRDVVTVTFLRPSFKGCIFLKFHGSDIRLTATPNPLLRTLARRLFKQVDAVGVLSTEERQYFIKGGFPEAKIFVVKNILRPEEFVADPAFRATHGIPEGTAVLLFTGRMIREKGLTDIIRALALIRQKRSDFVLFCLGDGPDRQPAEALVDSLNLRGYVRFTGHIPEEQTNAYYANASLLVFPTYHQEGFPMTVFRSVAAGLPILTTRIRAAADYLREPDNCIWVDPRNPEQLATRVGHLLAAPHLLATMAENNRALGRHFTAASIVPEFEHIYRTMLARRTS
jgi:glycosyltransferase involved in cell wall biosynthesis